jgi:SAM-dependent methyltransferase
LQFFPDRAAAVREMRRVLAPGGRAVVAVWRGLEVHPVFRLLGEAIASHQSVPVERLMRAFALGDAGTLHRLFDAAGFSGVEVFTETADVHFRPPERLVQMQVQGAAAVLPEFERMTDGERVALIAAVTESLGDAFDGYLRDGELVMPMYAHIVVASEEGESELYQDAGVG